MGEQFANWYRDQGEYITGALFGLIALDIFMFLAYVVTEKTTDGYGLTTLLIVTGIGLVAWVEKLYSEQDAAH